MTLTTHAIVGAAAMSATIAAAGTTPTGIALGALAGFASHFAIDAIPHWNEGRALMRSFEKDPYNRLATDMRGGVDFMHDLVLIAADVLLGLVLSALIFSFWLFSVPPLIVLFGAVAGMLPDALQFVYFKTHWHFMRPLQNFHVHLQTELMNPLSLGIEVVLMVVVVGVLKLFI